MKQFLREVFGWRVDFHEVQGVFCKIARSLVDDLYHSRVVLADVDAVPSRERDQVSVLKRFLEMPGVGGSDHEFLQNLCKQNLLSVIDPSEHRWLCYRWEKPN